MRPYRFAIAAFMQIPGMILLILLAKAVEMLLFGHFRPQGSERLPPFKGL